VAELLDPVHRIHRHDHRVGTQRRVEGDRELRAVLHEEGDAVARADAFALQPAGKRFGLRAKLAKVMLRPKKMNAGLSGKRAADTSTLNQSEVSGSVSERGRRLGQMRKCGRSAGTSNERGDDGTKGSGRGLRRRLEV
jgi:hypothetical protein